jgi:outer membrane biosynthesis protein TonB
MATNARIFFAGVGTTFIILGIGFGGGLFMANSALKEPAGYRARAKAEPSSPVRVVLPSSAEAAQAPAPSRPSQTLPQAAAVEPPSEQAKAAPPEKHVEKIDTRKAEADARERRKRYAERKAKREAVRARQQMEPRERVDAPVMAFGGDETQRGFGFFGN